MNKEPSELGNEIKKVIFDITCVSHAIRFVLVVDEKGNPIDSKVVTKSFLIKEKHAMPLAADMIVLKRLLALYDEIIGENSYTHLIRKHVHVLIFYIKGLIFLVSCERDTSRREIADISEKIESVIEKHLT